MQKVDLLPNSSCVVEESCINIAVRLAGLDL